MTRGAGARPPDVSRRSRFDSAGQASRFFDRAYFELHASLFSEAQSRHEVAGVIELLGLHAGACVLDLPCGWGRHTGLLASAGFEVCGADRSVELLRHARIAAPAARLAGADLRRLPFPDAHFDAVINIGSNLGVFVSDADAIAALREARRVLRAGRALLLESMHRDDVVARYAARDRWRLPDGTEVRARRRFDALQGVSYEILRWRRGSATGEKQHALRLRTATELARLLHAAGFDAVQYFGGWDGAPFRATSERLIAVARR